MRKRDAQIASPDLNLEPLKRGFRSASPQPSGHVCSPLVMISIPPQDGTLDALRGSVIGSHVTAGVSYSLGKQLGTGGMAIAFFAMRRAPDGEGPVVVKILRPEVVKEAGPNAALTVRKEAVALGRLNERVPPTPFVVRLIDAGSMRVQFAGQALDLPWLAIEYVHGGPAGTTLEERVLSCVRQSGQAFDAVRVAHAVECLGAGLDAIHEVEVVHRDLTPGNVLCCGLGEDEIFKIADFGIARPGGMAATFGGVVVGTPGYAPPEQFVLDTSGIGRWSDIFSFAAVIYFMLTRQHYFPVQSPADGVVLARRPDRPRLAKARALCGELRSRPAALESIDTALARATSVEPLQRPPTAGALASMVLSALRPPSTRRGGQPAQRSPRTLFSEAPTVLDGWQWSIRNRPGSDRVVRSVAWDGDGRCLAATSHGLAFWNGTAWLDAAAGGVASLPPIHFVRRVGPGRWLIGGEAATVAFYTSEGVTARLSGPDPSVTFVQASGDIEDLAVLVGTRPEAGSLLYAIASHRWVKPAAIKRAATIAAVAPIEDGRWIVCGRTHDDRALLVGYEPLMWQVDPYSASAARAYLACDARPELGLAYVVGTDGNAMRIAGGEIVASTVPDKPDLTAVAIDLAGRAWAASSGRIWAQLTDEPSRWSAVWSAPQLQVPIVSLFADVGMVIAMTADGGIIEGRFAS